MPDEGVGRLAAEAARLRAEVDASANDPAAHERIRERLLTLGREIEARIRELESVRESLRPVAAKYRTMFREPESSTRRFDHLGAAASRERGWSILSAGSFREAVADLRTALELDPRDLRTQAMLAWAYAGAGDPDRAGAIVHDLLGIDPHHPLGRMVLGYLHAERGEFADALRHLGAVVQEREDPTAVLYAHLYLGVAYAEQGMSREAQSYLHRAVELGPNLTEGYWELGRWHFNDGRPDLALEAWRTGGENRFSAWGERCRAAVARLEERSFGGAG